MQAQYILIQVVSIVKEFVDMYLKKGMPQVNTYHLDLKNSQVYAVSST